MKLTRTGDEGRTAVFSDGRIELTLQEGLWPGGRRGRRALRPRHPGPGLRAAAPAAPPPRRRCSAPWATSAQAALWAPLIRYVDLRELLRLPLDARHGEGAGRRRSACRGPSTAPALLTAFFFPEVAAAAAAVRPELGARGAGGGGAGGRRGPGLPTCAGAALAPARRRGGRPASLSFGSPP